MAACKSTSDRMEKKEVDESITALLGPLSFHSRALPEIEFIANDMEYTVYV